MGFTKGNRYFQNWCIGWAGLLESLASIITLGIFYFNLRLPCAHYFAKRNLMKRRP